jgi:hypothetical protein
MIAVDYVTGAFIGPVPPPARAALLTVIGGGMQRVAGRGGCALVGRSRTGKVNDSARWWTTCGLSADWLVLNAAKSGVRKYASRTLVHRLGR